MDSRHESDTSSPVRKIGSIPILEVYNDQTKKTDHFVILAPQQDREALGKSPSMTLMPIVVNQVNQSSVSLPPFQKCAVATAQYDLIHPDNVITQEHAAPLSPHAQPGVPTAPVLQASSATAEEEAESESDSDLADDAAQGIVTINPAFQKTTRRKARHRYIVCRPS
eukprot:GAFH01003416.1.p1 GENE.GAFH01003416.1~~GAFH01003416.1.p1  ORF type:complete len:167 (+),score=1.72 GAFH01003416.1:416-916(+)